MPMLRKEAWGIEDKTEATHEDKHEHGILHECGLLDEWVIGSSL